MSDSTSASTDKIAQYAHPDALVTTDWVAEHLHDPSVCVIESNEDILLYDTGHIPGAVHVDWRSDLQADEVRDYIDPERFAALCRRLGITPQTTCVFYGDKNNWWACYAFWVFQLFGHTSARVMDGGRAKWKAEGREMTREVPQPESSDYPVPSHRRDEEIRAFFVDTLEHMKAGKPMVDVRSPGEFRGEVTHMPEYPQEGVLRGGHIPGAKSKPWASAANEDGTFKTRPELEAIYQGELGFQPQDDVIAYCRIGERSSHTWFVLKYLLGFENVRNYDGSWTEWGNMVRVPIEKGD